MKYTSGVLFISLFITAIGLMFCTPRIKVNESNYYLLELPPNAVRISGNLYCDQTEITNQFWRDYMFWTIRIYGQNSYEYLKTLPDTNVWLENEECVLTYASEYLRHPAYKNYPVVGISQEQAREYSKWRTDRYFEGLLVRLNKITYDSAQTKETYFTTDKYFNNTYSRIISGEKLLYYPEFNLPTLQERKLIIHYSDSINKEYFDNCISKYCYNCKIEYPKIWSDISVCDTSKLNIWPTRSVYDDCVTKKAGAIFHLRGNVSEWISNDNVSAGGGWNGNRNKILSNDTVFTDNPNYATGFRNVSKWKHFGE